MLIDHPTISYRDPILSIVASVAGRDTGARKLRTGVYEIGHFGSSDWPRGFEQYPEFGTDFHCYGVCDDVDQILAACPELEASKEREFVITVTPIVRANESAPGGWRWRKWGPYIGTHKIEYEYIADEKGIEQVLVYHVYERQNASNSARP